MPREPALAASADRMSERSRQGVSEGLEGRSERPATGAWAAPNRRQGFRRALPIASHDGIMPS